MDISTLSQVIGSVGFPIVACLLMFYQNSKLQETLTELSNTLSCMNERLKDVEDSVKKND